MSAESTLMDAWRLRMPLTGARELQQSYRPQISRLFLRLAGMSTGGSDTSFELTQMAQELEQLARSNELDVAALQAELRSCQLCLVEQMLQQPPIPPGDEGQPRATVTAWDSVKNTVDKTDTLIDIAINRLFEQPKDRTTTGNVNKNAGSAQGESQSATELSSDKAKSLQHEIRTPLQGALLTAELMIEDIGHGDPVSEDDILSIRTSIETAVKILNEFAGRAKAGGTSVSDADAAQKQNAEPPADTNQGNQSNSA